MALKNLINAALPFLAICIVYLLPGPLLLIAAEIPEEYAELLPSPYSDVLDETSPRIEKKLTWEMLATLRATDPVYRGDTMLLEGIRLFQSELNIPEYDYKHCYAGPMTLNYLIAFFIRGPEPVGSYHRPLYKRHDPHRNPGDVNLGGADIAEFQLMYNAWAEDNNMPCITTPDGKKNGSPYLEVDGYYGQFTRAAAANFQEKEKILGKEDIIPGEVGNMTWKLLYVRTYYKRDSIIRLLLEWSDNFLACQKMVSSDQDKIPYFHS